MKRFMDLIHKILQYFELEGNGDPISNPEIEGYTQEQISYHIGLCAEAGLLHTVASDSINRPKKTPNRVIDLGRA